jgi:hypothetical protein
MSETNPPLFQVFELENQIKRMIRLNNGCEVSFKYEQVAKEDNTTLVVLNIFTYNYDHDEFMTLTSKVLNINTVEDINLQNIVMQFLKQTIVDLENGQSDLNLYSIEWSQKNCENRWTSYIKASLLTTAINKLLVGKNEDNYVIHQTKYVEPKQEIAEEPKN